ncbi:hypothetical protein ACHWQZ_G019240 [Mnemiopsis leidyi]
MSPKDNDAQTNYSSKVFNDMWEDLAPGYYNFGRFDPNTDISTITNLVDGNENMVRYIISQLGITKDSYLLDLGCGKGMYTVRIAEITGCKFVGVELNKEYVEQECKELAEKHGVAQQGEFVQSCMADIPERIRGGHYTHIISLGAALYVHDKMDKLLETISSCCNKDTQIFFWDVIRNAEWEEVRDVVQRHSKTGFPMLYCSPDKKCGRSKVFNDMWEDLAPGYYNFGRFDPNTDISTITNLVDGNENMVRYIISQLGITKDSYLLDLGCGKGMYTVRIAEITGCKFVGVELNKEYVEQECKELAEKHGVAQQGEFVQSCMADIPERIRGGHYTHIISLGAALYVHDKMDKLLKTISSCCNKDTQIFFWDVIRNAEWEEVRDVVQRHSKTGFPMLSRQEMWEKVEQAKFRLTKYEDFTPYILPGLKVLSRESKRRDPDTDNLTYPLFCEHFAEGKMAYVTFYFSLQ